MAGLPRSAAAWPQPQATRLIPSKPGTLVGTGLLTMPGPRPSCPRFEVPQAHTAPCSSTANAATPDAAPDVTWYHTSTPHLALQSSAALLIWHDTHTIMLRGWDNLGQHGASIVIDFAYPCRSQGCHEAWNQCCIVRDRCRTPQLKLSIAPPCPEASRTERIMIRSTLILHCHVIQPDPST